MNTFRDILSFLAPFAVGLMIYYALTELGKPKRATMFLAIIVGLFFAKLSIIAAPPFDQLCRWWLSCHFRRRRLGEAR